MGVNAFIDAENGWAKLSFLPTEIDSTLDQCDIDGDITTATDLENPCSRTIDAGDAQLYGLPVVGFAFQKYVNGDIDGSGVLANYAMATVHKTCVAGSGNVNSQC